jgi:hypothetical protein
MRRPTATLADVLSVPALFVALGGTSYAALTITGTNVKNSSLTTADIGNRSLLAVDFKSGQVPAGPHGEPGPIGPRGGVGPKGDSGVSGYVPVTRVSELDSSSSKQIGALCPVGTSVPGGGAFISASGAVAVKTSTSFSTGSGWFVEAIETAPDAGDWSVSGRAICAKVAP